MNNIIWLFIFLNLLINAPLGFIPASPLLAFIGGGCSSFFLQKHFLNKYEQPINKRTKVIFLFISSLFSGLLLGYLFTLYFYLTLQKPPEESWLRFETYEQIIRESPKFRFQFFFIASFIAAISNLIGGWIVFVLRIGAQKPSDEALLEGLSSEQLNKYLD